MEFEGRSARIASVGAVLWIACFQFFVCEQVVRLAWTLPYSFATNYVSDLGASVCSVSVCSPWHALMNSSFVLQGLLIGSGAVVSWKHWSVSGRIGLLLLLASGIGVIIVGFVPENANAGLHRFGAALHFLGAGIGLVVVGLSLRRWFGWASTGAGLVILAATLELATGGGSLQEEMGAGTLERVAAYGIAGWMVLLGLWSFARLNPVEHGCPSR